MWGRVQVVSRRAEEIPPLLGQKQIDFRPWLGIKEKVKASCADGQMHKVEGSAPVPEPSSEDGPEVQHH